MEKNRTSKIIAVVALVVAVLGLSLGFAAFSNTLTISSSAYVSPSSENFKIGFSTSATSVGATGSLTGTPTGTASAGTATLTGTTISGIQANLKAPGDTVTYTFYVHNTGEYDAYLNSITHENVTGQNAPKVCTAVDTTNTTSSLVSAACEDISISVKVGTDAAVAGSVASISGHKLSKLTYEPIVVTITYASDGDRADGDFNVAFGDIKLIYATVD